ncbi:hypothetical protein NM208_g1667 [Fusarium decemcellulare]|uniref:Uncharacterized protein n=1 Tax=Fusarium decemcellulare TaxID=57161 RepID=A0ACC1SV58_9HYPO|nr:hypothetical protein NM208_g1667 [Fusarium decemcellulare]
MSTTNELPEKDPFSFNIQLNTNEDLRDYHRKNEEGQIQRPDIVDDICRGLLLQARIDRIVHGTENAGGNPATLVVFGFRFHGIDENRRFKQAIITITFGDEKKRTKADPEVIALWPNGDFTLGETIDIDIETTAAGEVAAEVAAEAGAAKAGIQSAMQWERKKSYRVKDRSSLKGSIILDTKVREYGANNAIRLTINENTTAATGLVTDLRAVVLLRRPRKEQVVTTNPDDDCFIGTVKMTAKGHFAYNAIRGLRDLSGFAPANDPVKFKPGVQYLRPPTLSRFLETRLAVDIDENNLNTAELDDLVGVLSTTVLATSLQANMDNTTTGERRNGEWRFRIFLVGFPAVDTNLNTTLPMLEMIKCLVPEAPVSPHNIFRHCASESLQEYDLSPDDDEYGVQDGRLPPSEDRKSSLDDVAQSENKLEHDVHGATSLLSSDAEALRVNTAADLLSIPSLTSHAAFSPGWIQNEALSLLDRIQDRFTPGTNQTRSKVLLAGYGFGGIIIKQAVIIANTTPQFYDVALSIANLAFFATPHRLTGRSAWEEVLFSMLNATKMGYPGRLSQILLSLVESVSHLSHVFCRFAAKYPTVNFTYSVQSPGPGDAVDNYKFGNDVEKIVSWPTDSLDGLAYCRVDDVKQLTTLREHFAPSHVLSSAYDDIDTKVYFESLQALSPSRWIFFDQSMLERPDDYAHLRDTYRSHIRKVRFTSIRGGSVQVIGPPGQGKSALANLISHKIWQTSAVVLIENYPDPTERHPLTLYGAYISFIHQMISQQPLLFRPVQRLMSEMLNQNVWTEEMALSVLSSILNHSQNINYLIIVYDFERWPSEVRSWWARFEDMLPQSTGSTCTLVTSSAKSVPELKSSKSVLLDLTKEQAQYKTILIHNKIRELLDYGYGPVALREGLDSGIQNQIVSSAMAYNGSLSSVNTYLVRLFQTFTISSADAMLQSISAAPKTERELHEHQVKLVVHQSASIRQWAMRVISWTLLALRPLRVEELAVAAALDTDQSSLAETQSKLSMYMERDIRNHLDDLVLVENRHARINGPLAQKIRSGDNEMTSQLRLETNYTMTLRCLHYLVLVLGNERPGTWEDCLAQMTYKHRRKNPMNPVLELLHYACRFWPSHFLQVPNPDSLLKKEVVDFLRDPIISDRWFKLYSLGHAGSHGTDNYKDTPLPSAFPKETGSAFEGIGPSFDELRKVNDRPSSAEIAGQVGLESIVPSLTTEDEARGYGKVVGVQRGYAEHKVLLLDTSSGYYLDCIIATDDYDAIKDLLSREEDRTAKMFPLHRAAFMGRLQMVQFLLDLVDDPAQSNDQGQTPLHMAAIGGHSKIVRYLIGETCADSDAKKPYSTDMTNLQDNNQQTALMAAIEMGNIDTAMILANSGIQLTLQDDIGGTAIHHAVMYCPQLVEALVKLDEDALHIEDHADCTPLHLAAEVGSKTSVSAILNAARRSGQLFDMVNVSDASMKTPLHYAAENGHTSIAELLINAIGSGSSDSSEKSTHTGSSVDTNEADTEADSSESTDNMNGLGLNDTTLETPASLAAKRGHLATLKAVTHGKEDAYPSLLIDAAGAGQLLVVQYLLQSGVDPNHRNKGGSTPLSVAATKNYNEVVKALLQSSANINLEDQDRKTALHYAAEHGNQDIVLTLLHDKQKARIDAPDSQRYTPLHFASKKGYDRVVFLLLDAGSSVEARSQRGETPLHLAVRSRETVKELLDTGEGATEINAVDVLEQTPLHKAAQQNSLPSARLLIERGAVIESADGEGDFPMTHAIQHNDVDLIKELFTDLLVEHMSEASKWKNLTLAVEMHAPNTLSFLIDKLHDAVSMKDSLGNTLLHLAVKQDNLEVVNLLLDRGSDVNISGSRGRTPLHEAAAEGKLENMSKLLDYGAEVDKPDESSDTPLLTAAVEDDVDAISILLDAKANVNIRCGDEDTALYAAVCAGQFRATKQLLEAGSDISIARHEGWTPLHAAADNLAIMQLLVGYGPNFNINVKKDDDWTPIHLSASWGCPDVTKFLLDSGADPNLTNDLGESPLQVAIDSLHMSVTETLLEHAHSLDLDHQENDGHTPLHYAIVKNDVDLARRLVEMGADLTIETGNGTSYLAFVIRFSSASMLTTLFGDKDTTKPIALDRQQLIFAYWHAVRNEPVDTIWSDQPDNIRQEQAKMIDLLVKTDESIVTELSDGLNALEVVLSQEVQDNEPSEEKWVATRLVDLGIDPFCRTREDQKSAFELASISCNRVATEFFDACLQHLLQDPRTLKNLGFTELRISTELPETSLLQTLEPLRNRIPSTQTDQDDWNMDHFFYQAANRLSNSWDDDAIRRPTKLPKSLALLELWHPPESVPPERLQILPGGLDIVCGAPDLATPLDRISVRADSPFPPRQLGQSYFELKIQEAPNPTATDLQESTGSTGDPPGLRISIGFTGEFCNLKGRHAGWNVWSVGYHGDDGNIYEQSGEGKHQTHRTFGIGNTIGCGIDYEKDKYFFTLDAEGSDSVIFRKLYPCIGHAGDACKIKVNFGDESFVWSGAKSRSEIDAEARPPRLQRTFSRDERPDRSRRRTRRRSRSPPERRKLDLSGADRTRSRSRERSNNAR